MGRASAHIAKACLPTRAWGFQYSSPDDNHGETEIVTLQCLLSLDGIFLRGDQGIIREETKLAESSQIAHSESQHISWFNKNNTTKDNMKSAKAMACDQPILLISHKISCRLFWSQVASSSLSSPIEERISPLDRWSTSIYTGIEPLLNSGLCVTIRLQCYRELHYKGKNYIPQDRGSVILATLSP